MRYMMMIKATRESEAGAPPNPQLMAAMAKLTEEAFASGTMIATDGLTPSSQGTRICYSDGTRTITDGPFTETKEVIGGYALVRVNSKAEAIDFANRALEAHIQAGVQEVNMELRPLFEASDFR